MDGSRRKRRSKRSCYDHDVCPLYCAWGVDLFDLFKNTKSDLGSNDYIVDDDAREEYLSLPDHEKERLGYEFMLYRKITDLVRGCNRIVDRNREKLKAEIAKNARQRAEGKNEAVVMDISQYVDSEHLAKCAENVASLELLEEEVGTLVKELEGLEEQQHLLQSKIRPQTDGKTNGENSTATIKDQPTQNNSNNNNILADNNILQTADNNSNSVETQKDHVENATRGLSLSNDPLVIKQELQDLSNKQQYILTRISQIVSDNIHPLRDTTENQKRQLYYVRSDTTSDKNVCEVSGNFMSSRDADERIAAHYAGKQYVGWKMVRAKGKEMGKKYGKLNAGPPQRYGGAPPPPHAGGFRGPPPYGGGGGYGGPPNRGLEQHHRGNDRHRDRSRSRDRGDREAESHHSRHHRGGRRSPSPARWERDRGPGSSSSSRGYERGGQHHRSHHRKRSGGRDRDRRR